jgi:hypothetical protein
MLVINRVESAKKTMVLCKAAVEEIFLKDENWKGIDKSALIASINSMFIYATRG